MPPRALLDVVRGALMGILPVREVSGLCEAGDETVGERLTSQEPGRDRSLVRRGCRERLGRQAPPRVLREPPRRAQLLEDLRVTLRRADGRAGGKVLRGSAQHRRPADVDHLDRVRLGDAVARDDLREGVEAHAHEVERLDAVVVERGQVVRMVAARQDRRVDPRVERLHAAAEHLRDLGQLFHRRRVDPALREMLGGAAACDEVDSEVLETLRELDQPGLVPGGQESAADHSIRPRTVSDRSRCSTAWTRARSVSTVSPSCTGTGSATITSPVSTPSSTKWTVAAVWRTPAARTSSIGWAPGNSGSGAECVFTIRPAKRSTNGLRRRGMYPAHTTSVTPCASSQRPIASSRSSRVSKSSSGKLRAATPALLARSSAGAAALFDATQATGRPASSSAWRFVPSPEARTPITPRRSARSLGRLSPGGRRRSSRHRG